MQSKGGNHTVDFEIRGNDSYSEGSPNPNNYAIATLVFSAGKLTDASLKSAGQGYTYVAQANLASGFGNTVPFSSPQTNIIPINASLLESWYTVPFMDYQDWYLITDTKATAAALTGGDFGSLRVSLDPLSADAQNLITSTPITTGYSGVGQQQKFSRPQTGTVSLLDSLGQQVGIGSVLNGASSITITSRPAPGLVNATFDGDHSSSYLVNFKPSSTSLDLNYGNWSGVVTKSDASSLTFSSDINLSVSRTDVLGGDVSFGLRSANSSINLSLLNSAVSAKSGVLTLNAIYSSTAWQDSEGRAIGSAANTSVSSGSWVPTATRNGEELALKELIVNGNNVTAIYTDNVTGVFTLGGTGTAINPGTINPVLTVQRLGRYNNSLAFYQADSVTGAIFANGATLLPGSPGYLQAALGNAKSAGLVLQASQLPGYKQASTIDSLPLNLSNNYGLLLMVNGSESEIYSSYSAANPGGVSQFLTFGSTNRGLTIGIEDQLVSSRSDRDFNDLILTIASSAFTLI
jgi:hypothetical protein